MVTTFYSMSLCPWPMCMGIHFEKETPTLDGTSLCYSCMEWTWYIIYTEQYIYMWSTTFIYGGFFVVLTQMAPHNYQQECRKGCDCTYQTTAIFTLCMGCIYSSCNRWSSCRMWSWLTSLQQLQQQSMWSTLVPMSTWFSPWWWWCCASCTVICQHLSASSLPSAFHAL